METPQDKEQSGDLLLVHKVIQGAEGAWEQFVRRHSDLIYSFCHLVFPIDAVADEYLNILRSLRADDFAILRAFNGRAKLSTYLTLKIADLLATRLLRIFNEDPERAWKAFESFFKADITRIIARQFPFSPMHQTLDDGSSREDLYQEICVLLVEQDYRRLRSYDERGSFTGYIRQIVRNLCMDLFRKRQGRRRIPEVILQLPELEQEIFKLLNWRGCAEQDLFNVLFNERANTYSVAQVEQAIVRVKGARLSSRFGSKSHEERPRTSSLTWGTEETPVKEREIADFKSSPEREAIAAEERAAQEKTLAKLQQVVAELPADEQIYIRLRYYTTPTKSPRDIARIMGRSEEEIYKLRQKATSRLRAALKTDEKGKITELSV